MTDPTHFSHAVASSHDGGTVGPEVYHQLAAALTSHLTLTELLQSALDGLATALDREDFSVLLLWDPGDGVFRVEAVSGEVFEDQDALSLLSLKPGEGITGKAYELERPMLLESASEVSQTMQSLSTDNRESIVKALGAGRQIERVAAMPLTSGKHRFGVLLLGGLAQSSAITEANLPVLTTLANLISLAIDRTRLEDEAVAIREAGLSGRLQAEALATLSHELRTPLATIKGYSTAMLLEEVSWPDDKRREFLTLIDSQCDDLETMITDMLDASLIDVGQLVLELQPVRLARLVREVVDEIRGRTNEHHLVLDFPVDVPILDADPTRIKQVVRNILDNAVKYSPDGGMVVIRGIVRSDDVVVAIADQGVGISPEDLIPLFDRYFRVKSPTGYHVPGTGLGLPVARAIIEAHGGRIWAESRAGEGTTLFFSLPLIESDQSDRVISVEAAGR